jgi:hypothetical protein
MSQTVFQYTEHMRNVIEELHRVTYRIRSDLDRDKNNGWVSILRCKVCKSVSIRGISPLSLVNRYILRDHYTCARCSWIPLYTLGDDPEIKKGIKLKHCTIEKRVTMKSLFDLCMDMYSRPHQLYILEQISPI